MSAVQERGEATVTVRYWAAARAAAGTSEDAVPAGSLAAVLEAARARHPEGRFSQVLAVCSLLVDGGPVGRRDHREVHVGPGTVVEVLPPFAGG
jgi:molybdopterin converting factor small subunit